MSDEKAAPLIKRYVIQVNQGRPRLGIDLTLCPKSVIPHACNQKIEFTAKIYAFKNGKWVYPGEKRKITFSFMEVSKERGVCMNYPIKDKNNITPASPIASNTNPDLFFHEDDPRMKDFDFDEDETDSDADKKCPTEILVADDNPGHIHHYQKVTTKNAVTEAKVVVRCEDYGAFGVLKAEADDCETLKPRERDAGCSKDLGKNDVRIPRDCNKPDRNYIADSAKSWDNVSLDKYGDGSDAKANEDKDNEPVTDNYEGDGLTNYEEYRGFIVGKKLINKRHIRTNINNKDVFIYDKDNLLTGFFNESGLIIHFLPGPDYYNGDSKDKNVVDGMRGDHVPDPSDSQCINCNRTSHSGGDQHCVRLVKITIPGLYGYTYGGGPGLPKVTHKVGINHGLCTRLSEPANQLSATVAHELGHSVNVFHHGPNPRKPIHKHGGIKSDRLGRVTSGDVNCFMRYDNYRRIWCHDTGAGHCIHEIPKPEPTGTTFCDSQDGTGCNASGFDLVNRPCATTNDAAGDRGNCKSHIRVKDW
jgi:hypothetical protein